MQPNRQQTASPFISPSTSPGAMSQPSSDSDWSGEWNLGTPAPPSRTTTPALSAGRSTPQTGSVTLSHEQLDIILKCIAAQGATYVDGGFANSANGLPAVPAFNFGEPSTSLSRPATPESPKRKRIPRPPNAFMLYRSHLLKTRQIPPGIEHRQQNISRVAGECWNMLPPAEKKRWHDEAKRVLNEHMAKHPDYKFSPERKSSRRKTAQDPEVPATDGKDYIRFLREKYFGLKGPAVTPPRPRKTKSRRGAEADGSSSMSLPSSLQASPSSTPGSSGYSSAPSSSTSSPSLQQSPPKFDLNIFQNYGMPPFSGALPQDNSAQYASHAAKASPLDDDVTPKASTFGDISLPTQPKFNFPPALSYPTCATTAESHLGLHGLALPSNVSGVPAQGSSRPTTPAQPQAPGLDRMWNSIFQEPFGQSGVSGPSMLSSLDESAPSPFGTSDLSGPIDFDNMSFPSLFPESD